MAGRTQQASVERAQLGVRMEKYMVKVLKGLAEFDGITLGQLLEKIVLHSFEPVPGQEGEMCASPHGKRALAAIADLKRIYGMDYDVHALRRDLARAPEPERSATWLSSGGKDRDACGDRADDARNRPL